MRLRALAASASVLVLAGSGVFALPFDGSTVSGSATLRVGNAGFAPETVQTTPIVFPEVFSQQLTSSYTGAQAGLDYTLGTVGETVVFDFYAMDYTGTGSDNKDGNVSADLTFKTDVDALFCFTAVTPYSPETGLFSFIATFNGIVAQKYFDRDAPGGLAGTFPSGGCPGCPPLKTFTATGFLPAGMHSLSLAQGGSYRGYSGMSDSTVNLTLKPVPEMTTAMLSAMGLSSLVLWRRRRVVRGRRDPM